MEADVHPLAQTVEVGDLPVRHAARAAAEGAPRRAQSHTTTNSEDARALQERVALMSIVGTVLSLLALVIFWVGQVFAGVNADVDMISSRAPHLAAIAITAIAWLIVRKTPRSVTVLRFVEGATMLGLVVAFTVMAGTFPRYTRPELVAALITLVVTLTRAILVPSSAMRTAILTSIAWLPAFLLAYFTFRHLGIRVDDGTIAPYLARALTETTTWSVLGTTLVTVASQVIYGLQREVREAKKLGQYTLLEKLGEGGMGQVFRAQHAMLRRPTAVKLLHPDRNAGPESLARFEREVQLTAQLSHPNVVTVFDYGRTPLGVFYYAMELLDGLDLETVVERSGPMPAARAAKVLAQVASALAEAHAVGLIHRDIKPANIILCVRRQATDVAKVVDFGLVKDLGDVRHELTASTADLDVEAAPSLSRTGAILGTPMYLAPEALLDPAAVDGRADLYALGAVGYFLLTGTVVFGGSNVVEVCRHHLHTTPVAPSVRLQKRDASASIPPALEAIILRCLEKRPEDRFADASALEAALLAV